MNPADRKKMCSSCDGMIPIDAEVCPYCTADQSHTMTESSYQAPLFKHQTLQESLTSLYTPPYSSKGQMSSPEEPSVPSSKKKKETPKGPTFRNEVKMEMPAIAIPAMESETDEQQQEKAQGGTFWAVFMMSLAAILLNLGLLQLFFSSNGVLRLEWNSAYWFIYCLISLPLFYLGFKKANTFK
jgi:hypothetical protein